MSDRFNKIVGISLALFRAVEVITCVNLALTFYGKGRKN